MEAFVLLESSEIVHLIALFAQNLSSGANTTSEKVPYQNM